MKCVRRRLNKDWVDAVKYEQMYLEFVKESSLEAKELMETESSNRLKEYNKNLMMKMSMRSILG